VAPSLTQTPRPPAAIVVTTISPLTGPVYGNSPVLITGAGFHPAVRVAFGDIPATVLTVSDSRLSVITQSHEGGTVDVVVTNPDGGIARLSDAYVFEVRAPGPPPTLTSVVPNVGSTAGRTTVRISGSGFEPGMTVTLGGSTIRPTVRNGNEVYVLTEPGGAGVHDVVLINPDGQSATRTAGYTYASAASFNLNGTWEGRAGDHWDFAFRFIVNDDVITVISCEQATLPFSRPLSLRTETFAAVEQGIVVFAGAFVSESHGTGTVILPPCVEAGRATHWEASKVAP
jgi:hypothetical protein